jgi:hypothetical protein
MNGMTRRERQIFDIDKMLEILDKSKVVHVGMVDGDEPYVVPMNYGYTYENEKLEEIGNKYGVSKTTVAFALILRHPAKMQPVTGTTNLTRLTDCIKASEINLTREEWYEIYRSAGNILP